MKREHCDNCDATIEAVALNPARRHTISPRKYECEVTVQIAKRSGYIDMLPQHLCRVCLTAAVEEWLTKLRDAK